MFKLKNNSRGFTLVELMVVISIIGILAAVLYASFGEARAQARDKIRMASLKEVQLALELYKAQNGHYPAKGCSVTGAGWVGPGTYDSEGYGYSNFFHTCEEYIDGLVPDYIPVLPTDPLSENEPSMGFMYNTDAAGSAYKVMVLNSVETFVVDSFTDEFSRCPVSGSGDGMVTGCGGTVPSNTYAVYSAGAEPW